MFGKISRCMIFSDQLLMTLSGCVDRWQGHLYSSWFTKSLLQARILNVFKPWVVFKQKETNKHTQVLVFASLLALAMAPSCTFKAFLSLTTPSDMSALCVQCSLHSSYSGFLGLSSNKRPNTVFLTCCDLRSSRIISKQSNTWVRVTIVVHPEKSWSCIINNACLEHCISVACFILL